MKKLLAEFEMIYIQRMKAFSPAITLLSLGLPTLIIIRVLCSVQTFLVLAGMHFLPYATAFRASLAWCAASAFLAGIALCELGYSILNRI